LQLASAAGRSQGRYRGTQLLSAVCRWGNGMEHYWALACRWTLQYVFSYCLSRKNFRVRGLNWHVVTLVLVEEM
jgi:hypothetical protein